MGYSGKALTPDNVRIPDPGQASLLTFRFWHPDALPLISAVETAALNAKYGHPGKEEIEMIRFLLDHGADPSIRNRDGKTAADLAGEIKDAQARKSILDLLASKKR